jgi:hypothetical protein
MLIQVIQVMCIDKWHHMTQTGKASFLQQQHNNNKKKKYYSYCYYYYYYFYDLTAQFDTAPSKYLKCD